VEPVETIQHLRHELIESEWFVTIEASVSEFFGNSELNLFQVLQRSQ
jgi:hypothetical protein